MISDVSVLSFPLFLSVGPVTRPVAGLFFSSVSVVYEAILFLVCSVGQNTVSKSTKQRTHGDSKPIGDCNICSLIKNLFPAETHVNVWVFYPIMIRSHKHIYFTRSSTAVGDKRCSRQAPRYDLLCIFYSGVFKH